MAIEYIDIVTRFGALGVICWLVWYLFTKFIPDRDDKFTLSLVAMMELNDRQQKNYEASLIKLQESFSKNLGSISDHHKDQMQAMWVRIDRVILEREQKQDKSPITFDQ